MSEMDKLTKEQRKKNMQAVKSKGSLIETLLAKKLWEKGYRYRKNNKTVYGKPDLTFKKYKIAVFVDGDFWHGRNWETKKFDHKSNQEFWHTKIEKNIRRDKKVNTHLAKDGWNVIRFWGSEIENELISCVQIIEQKINDSKRKMEFKEFYKNDLKIKTAGTTEHGEAAFTHYLKNHQNGVSKFFKKEALKHVKCSINYKFTEEDITMKVAEEALQYMLFDFKKNVPFPDPINPKFKFIDLFAGIGGFRIAFQGLNGKCVYTSELDEQAKKTYQANFGEVPFGDITKENTKKFIPNDFDILCAGFPCQAFSIAGKRGGFEDIRGTLFFEVAEIIKRKKPKAIFLENVKGLFNHDKGKTIQTILSVLRNDLDYFVPDPKIINAKHYGVPQNRERVFIVGFRKNLGITEFEYPKSIKRNVRFKDVKEKEVVSVKYYLSNRYLNTLIKHKKRHENKGNGFGYEIISDNNIANAVVCGGMGRERNLVYDDRLEDFTPITHIQGKVNRKGIRKMTPREWARLQGFPDKFLIPVADASAYKQFGNSVAIPAIKATANEIIKRILK